MTSISATAGSSYQSPLQLLQDQLQAEVNSGAISSSDQGALSTALNNINSSLQSNPATDPGSTANSSPVNAAYAEMYCCNISNMVKKS